MPAREDTRLEVIRRKLRAVTAVLQDRKHGPYRTQRLSASSPMELMLHLLERNRSYHYVQGEIQPHKYDSNANRFLTSF